MNGRYTGNGFTPAQEHYLNRRCKEPEKPLSLQAMLRLIVDEAMERDSQMADAQSRAGPDKVVLEQPPKAETVSPREMFNYCIKRLHLGDRFERYEFLPEAELWIDDLPISSKRLATLTKTYRTFRRKQDLIDQNG